MVSGLRPDTNSTPPALSVYESTQAMSLKAAEPPMIMMIGSVGMAS